VRTFSLWLTLNALLFHLADKAVQSRSATSGQAGRAWGQINKRHAIEFAKAHLDLGEAALIADFSSTFRWPRLRFIGTALRYLFGRR